MQLQPWNRRLIGSVCQQAMHQAGGGSPGDGHAAVTACFNPVADGFQQYLGTDPSQVLGIFCHQDVIICDHEVNCSLIGSAS
jgi:hypothetical protein